MITSVLEKRIGEIEKRVESLRREINILKENLYEIEAKKNARFRPDRPGYRRDNRLF